MVYHQLKNNSGVLEFEPPEPSDFNVFGVYLPALELKIARSPEGRLIAVWLTEDGSVLARVDAGRA